MDTEFDFSNIKAAISSKQYNLSQLKKLNTELENLQFLTQTGINYFNHDKSGVSRIPNERRMHPYKRPESSIIYKNIDEDIKKIREIMADGKLKVEYNGRWKDLPLELRNEIKTYNSKKMSNDITGQASPKDEITGQASS